MSNFAFRPTLGPSFAEDDDDLADVSSDRPIYKEHPWLRRLAVIAAFCAASSFAMGAFLASGRDPLFADSALSQGFAGTEGMSSLVAWHRIVGVATVLLTFASVCGTILIERRHWVRLLGIVIGGLALIQVGVVSSWTFLGMSPNSRLGLWLIHPFSGQLLVAMLVLHAYAFSRGLVMRANTVPLKASSPLFAASVWYLMLIVVQAGSGTLVRLADASLAVPDFPFMGGGLLPFFGESQLHLINELRADIGLAPASQGQVILHLLHRLGAVLLLFGGSILALKLIRSDEYQRSRARFSSVLLLSFLFGQALIGGALVWSLLDPFLLVVHLVCALGILTSAGILSIQLKHCA